MLVSKSTDVRHTSFNLVLLFQQLSNEFNDEPHLLPQTADNLLAQFQAGLSVVEVRNNQIVGHITLWPLGNNWYERGSLWVKNGYRFQGIGKSLQCQVMAEHPRFHIMGTTTNEVVSHMNEEIGLKRWSFWRLPQVTHQATCVCSSEKTGSTDNFSCQLKDTVCQAWVRLATD